MSKCNLCPRACGIDRESKKGYCGVTNVIKAGRAGLHFWEEPCISGIGGSGAVFFSGCNLHCVYCQNMPISSGATGKQITEDRLREIFYELIDAGADNINLVTPTHYSDVIARALAAEKLPVPVVYNTSAYETVEALKRLDGLVDIYLPDYKYCRADIAEKFSFARDYPETAAVAIEEMYRQRGKYRFDEDGMLVSGVLIRHLVLPGHIDNSLDFLDLLSEKYAPDEVLFSVMSQYTPPKNALKYPELNRRLTKEEYERVTDYLYLLGLENGFVQELSSAKEEYTPEFDGSGI